MIYLVRHGLDDERYVGGYSDIGLLEKGKQQAYDVALWLKRENKHFDVIYTSDVKRAIETAEIIKKVIPRDIVIAKEFRELDKGKLNGMLVTLAKEKYPSYFDNVTVDMVYPDGESMQQLYDRIRRVYDKISNYDNALIVTHRGVINMLYFMVYDKKLDMNKEQFGVVHGSIHEFDIDKRYIRRVK